LECTVTHFAVIEDAGAFFLIDTKMKESVGPPTKDRAAAIDAFEKARREVLRDMARERGEPSPAVAASKESARAAWEAHVQNVSGQPTAEMDPPKRRKRT
jgi:hypothetical protein